MLASAAMGTRRRPLRPGRHRLVFATVVTAWLLAGCGGAAPSPTSTPVPSPTPTPLPTPRPPLTEPAHADEVYLALLADDIVIAPINADTGVGGRDPVKRIHATYDGWPLAISEYKSSRTLASATHWAAGTKPGSGEAPIAFIGLNILVQWGPIASTTQPKTPDGKKLASAGRLRDALARLVAPLSERTIVPIPPITPVSSPGSSAGAGPSAAPTATP